MRSAPPYSQGSTTGLAQAVLVFPQPGNRIAAAKTQCRYLGLRSRAASCSSSTHCISAASTPQLALCIGALHTPGAIDMEMHQASCPCHGGSCSALAPCAAAQVQQHANAANMQAFEQRHCFCQRCILCYRHGHRQQGSPLAVRAGAEPGTQLLVTNPTSSLALSSPHEVDCLFSEASAALC